MSSTSFLGFASPNLLFLSELVTFKEPVTYFFRQIWDFLWVFHLFISVPYFGSLVVDTEIRFFALESTKEKVLDKAQNIFLM